MSLKKNTKAELIAFLEDAEIARATAVDSLTALTRENKDLERRHEQTLHDLDKREDINNAICRNAERVYDQIRRTMDDYVEIHDIQPESEIGRLFALIERRLPKNWLSDPHQYSEV